MTSPDDSDRLLFRVLPILALVVGAVGWIWLALSVHTMPVIGGELDHYGARAQALLEGRLESDRLHPMGLPLLMAGLGLFGIEPFTAGRLIGVASGLLLVTCTYLLLRVWTTRLVAALAACAVGTSQFVLTCAVQACTDVPSAAVVSVALLCWTRCATAHRAPVRLLLLGGFALGLAGSLRMPALALSPAFLPLLLGIGWRERLRRVGWSTLAGAVGLAPHLVTLWLSTGSLFQNSHQIVWKYRYLDDNVGFLAYLQDPTPVSWHELRHWLWLGCQDWLGYLSSGLGSPWSPFLSGWTAVVVSLWLVGAMLLPLLLRHRAAAVLAIGAWSYSCALGIFGLPQDRMTIPMAAPVIVLATLAWARPPGRLRAVPLVVAGTVAVITLCRLPDTIERFEHLHARAEMAAARQLIEEHGEWISIATPPIGIEPGIPCIFSFYWPSAPAPGATTHWQRLLANPVAKAARFLVVGRDTWPLVYAEMSTQPPPAGYELRRQDAVLVFAKTELARWCDVATATVVGSDIHLELRLAEDVDRTKLLAAGFLVRSHANGEWAPMMLQPGPDGSFMTVLPGNPTAPASRWSFIPAMMHWNGTKQTGAVIEVEVNGATNGR